MLESDKTHSVLMGYLLWIFGFIGAHRFYYGRPISGTIWLFTLGLLGVAPEDARRKVELLATLEVIRVEVASVSELAETDRGAHQSAVCELHGRSQSRHLHLGARLFQQRGQRRFVDAEGRGAPRGQSGQEPHPKRAHQAH